MFFLLPISHENLSVRRWPVFTLLVIALNALVLIYSMARAPGDEAAIASAAAAAQAFADAHRGADQVVPGCVTRAAPSMHLGVGLDAASPAAGEANAEVDSKDQPALTESDRARIRMLCAATDQAKQNSFAFRYGLVPAHPSAYGFITHQFLHAGILHLVFNMWFLWLCGCNLEDRWGRAIFPAFYLTAGVVGALLHGRLDGNTEVPLIGASGAVAGAMGAFLAVLGATRIRFAYLIWVTFKPKYGTFEASGYFMLPLWLVSEFLSALLSTDAGTAHWAHVGGFAFGLCVGLALKLSGADARLDRAVEDSMTVYQNAELLAAAELTDRGLYQQAITALQGLAQKEPASFDIQVELLRAAAAAGDRPLRIHTSVGLVRSYLTAGHVDAARDLFGEMRTLQLDRNLHRAESFELAEAFARCQALDEAAALFARVTRDGLVDELAVRAQVSEATILVKKKRDIDARRLLGECRESPFTTVELDGRIQSQLAILGPEAIDM